MKIIGTRRVLSFILGNAMQGRYRKDIDGLRAISIVAVFIFHLLPNKFPGGSIGVDIFFVISGYLVGGNVLDQMRDGKFSLKIFLFKRFRRIYPALLLVIIFVEIFSIVSSLPDELIRVNISAISSIFSFSNIYFWKTTSYFDNTSSAAPLLHTWSLGVEEQFYIMCPAVLFLLFKYARDYVHVGIFILFIISISLSIYLSVDNPSSSFYFLHTRAWEFIIGIYAKGYEKSHRRLWISSPLIRSIAIAILIASLILINPKYGWPSYLGLIPCVAAGLILLSDERQTGIAKYALTLLPVRMIGIISYSLYLWHWPVIVFYKQIMVTEVARGLMIPICVSLTTVLAFLSWKFVEQPMRRVADAAGVFKPCFVGSAIALALASCAVVAQGYPARFDPEVRRIAAFRGQYDEAGRSCLWGVTGISPSKEKCFTVLSGKRNAVLIGDSHAAMFRSAIASQWDLNVLEIAAVACQVDLIVVDSPKSACARYMSQAMKREIDWDRISVVFLSSRWLDVDKSKLRKLVEYFGDIKVIIVGPSAEYMINFPKLMAISKYKNDVLLIDERLDKDIIKRDEVMKGLAKDNGLTYMSPFGSMCRKNRSLICKHLVKGNPILLDRDHLSLEGAKLLMGNMSKTAGLSRID